MKNIRRILSLLGIHPVLDILPAEEPRRPRVLRYGYATDYDALYGDWARVGNDIHEAIRRDKAAHEVHHESHEQEAETRPRRGEKAL